MGRRVPANAVNLGKIGILRLHQLPFAGDDAVLERGHQIYKRLRKISSAGGKTRENGKRAIQNSSCSQRVKGPGGGYKSVPVNAAARVLQEEQIARLARVLVVRVVRRDLSPSPAAQWWPLL